MAVRTVCKTRRAICIQGALVVIGPHRDAAERAQGRIATQQSKPRAASRHSGANPGTHRNAAAKPRRRIATQQPETAKGPGITGALHAMVDRQGLEPWTLGLRVPCSTS